MRITQFENNLRTKHGSINLKKLQKYKEKNFFKSQNLGTKLVLIKFKNKYSSYQITRLLIKALAVNWLII